MKLLNRDSIIVKEIKCMLQREGYESGSRLPSERELAERFGVQRLTLRSALQSLIREGVIESRERSGYYVKPERIRIQLNRFRPVKQGETENTRSELVSMERIELDKELSKKLELPLVTRVYRMKRIRYLINEKGEEPISIDRSYIPESIAPKLMKYDVEERSLYEILRTEYGVVPNRSMQKVGVVYANEEEAGQLGVSLMKPLVKQRGRVYSTENDFVEYSESVMKAEHFVFYQGNPIVEEKVKLWKI